MNRNQLKLVMMGLMVLDYIDHFLSPELGLIFHVVTRCVGVFFGYMAVEGVKHTRNVYRYNVRLYFWAAIMAAGNFLLNYFLDSPAAAVHNNIFLTLAIGVTILILMQAIEKDKGAVRKISLLLVLAGLLLSGAMFLEGGLVVLPFMVISYVSYHRIAIRNILYLTFAMLLLMTSFQWLGDWSATLEMLAYNSDFMFILVIPILYLYNGEKGSEAQFFKYFFYGFYPLHLWLIAVLANTIV